jgi:hypothetical protein
MSTPNILSSLLLHAAAFVDGPTGALIGEGINIAGFVKNGTGDYSFTWGTEIDQPTQLFTCITPIYPGAGIVPTVAAQYAPPPGGKDGVQIRAFDSADGVTPLDALFTLIAFRGRLP